MARRPTTSGTRAAATSGPDDPAGNSTHGATAARSARSVHKDGTHAAEVIHADDRHALTEAEIASFVKGVTDGTVSEGQISAFVLILSTA